MVEAVAATTHVLPIRVYYEDTDAAGIVYYANYLKFAERARTEMMREYSAGHYARMLADGLAFVVRRCSIDYAAAARLDDMIEIRTRLIRLGGASVAVEQTVYREDERLAGMEVKLACVGSDGRPARIPDGLRDVIGNGALANEP